jgi:hypothetical protein
VTVDRSRRVPVQRVGSTGVAASLNLVVPVCSGISLSVPARLRYESQDPYAVCLDSHVNTDAPITWMFARELLATGLREWTGIGDVSVYPGAHCRQALYICLSDDLDTAVLRAHAPTVRDFLEHTECLVPFGAEPDHLDLDGLLLRLFDG